MNPQELQPASFRGVPFLVSSAAIAGGRKTAVKQFANSDLQVVEDLGLKQRSFTVSGVVAARRDANGAEIRPYKEIRDALLAALEKGGVGILVHPFFGRIENVAVISFSFTEDMTKLGDSPIEITFEISNGDGLPTADESVIGSIEAAAETVNASSIGDITDRFSVTDAFTGNFGDALAKITAVATAVSKAVSRIAVADDKVDGFDRQISSYENDAVSFVGDPADLAQSTVSLVGSVASLYDAPQDVLVTYARLFSFGEDDVPFELTTAGRIERDRNRKVLNSNVQAGALAGSYVAASEVDFKNTDEIDATSEALEAQYLKMSESDSVDPAVLEELTKMRVSTNRFFDQQRDSRPRVVTVRTPLTSTRLLSYQYYGSSELGDQIADLNGLTDSAFAEGEVKVLTS